MERYICPVIDKKICPYEDVESSFCNEKGVYELCEKCTIPDIYVGIRPNVPESHCEAGKHMPYDTELKPASPELLEQIEKMKNDAPYYMDELYNYLNDRSDVFKKMALDERGRLMCELKNVLDKWNIK